MQVDFYQLSRDPVERVVPLLANKALESDARVVVACDDAVQRAAISEALWTRDGAFLAHGEAGEAHAERQPIMLGEGCEATNGASLAIVADGKWREAAGDLERAILLFASDQTDTARALWKTLKGTGHSLRFFAQDGEGRWKHQG